MNDETIYLSSVRSGGDRGAVFEWDGATGRFYLCATAPVDAPQILKQIHIVSGRLEFSEQDLEIRWDARERVVGLLVHGRPWAAFDASSDSAFGGDYTATGNPDVPLALQASLIRQ